MSNRIYLAIDLKSFYASVECIERGLDPLKTNLVVADNSRTEKTICLALSPSLKSFGIGGRPRLFEVVQKIKQINALRLSKIPGRKFEGESFNYEDLKTNPKIAIDYIVATPRMAYYMEYSTNIYKIYLEYIAPEDIHVYSIDEVFIDLTKYLKTYGLSAYELTEKILKDVLKRTGITATAGLGSNLYLAKIAMDILAKKMPVGEDRMQIAYLNEEIYKDKLWDHRPITDFWRVGPGYAKRLEKQGLYTMGDVARCSLGASNEYFNQELLYKIFGVNAELLIDHAWGIEPVTMKDIKAYKPESKSLGSGQVLQSAYDFDKAKLIVWEMADLLTLDLVAKGYKTNQVVLRISFDRESVENPCIRKHYDGPIVKDAYGRSKPKSIQGTWNFPQHTSSSKEITEGVVELYNQICHKKLLIRKLSMSANNLLNEKEIEEVESVKQMDLFSLAMDSNDKREKENERMKERKIQETMISLKDRFGKKCHIKRS